mgnify:CR=1 FL=1
MSILKKGKLFKDKEIKDLLAKDYKKYNKQIIDLDKKISNEKEKPNFVKEDLRKSINRALKPLAPSI